MIVVSWLGVVAAVILVDDPDSHSGDRIGDILALLFFFLSKITLRSSAGLRGLFRVRLAV